MPPNELQELTALRAAAQEQETLAGHESAMPNGHNGIPRFTHPLLLLIACGLATRFYSDHSSIWLAGLAVALAAGFGWTLSFNWLMWDAMDYSGAYTPAEQLADARRKHRVRAPLLVVGSVAVVIGFLFWLSRSS